ncbi:MAG: hypothetical protein AB7S70_06845 [Hyphomicrobium sp.]|uniref:hypothetical protein n=1 Tax=Hyphomicrobium sp. TaxID=82 RepID=UPI003D0FABF2
MTHTDEKTMKKKAELDEELESALEATFPASDAVAIEKTTTDAPDRPLHRRPPKIDRKLVDKLAKKVAEKKKPDAA